MSTQPTLEQYQTMIQNLSSAGGAQYVSAAVTMLARTKPVEAQNIDAIGHGETQVEALFLLLQDEKFELQRRLAAEAPGRGVDEFATLLYFGYTGAPLRQPEPEPQPVVPQAIGCGICFDDFPAEDIARVTGCDHAYCRECFHMFVLNRIDAQDLMPTCPHDGCEIVISDANLMLVLTKDQQEHYERTCLDIAIANEPGLFQCLQPNCRGIAALPDHNPHFVCPTCRAERCVQCNTREWHAGLTCEQLRQRTKDSELHPEQLRQMYGNSDVYQCGACSFGPIEKDGCANLKTHHGEARGNTRIDNCCPRCGWFASDIAQWPRWNGQLHASVRDTGDASDDDDDDDDELLVSFLTKRELPQP